MTTTLQPDMPSSIDLHAQFDSKRRPTLTQAKAAHRTCGLTGGVGGSAGAVFLALQLQDRFHSLRTTLPNLAGILDHLINLSSIRTTRPRGSQPAEAAPPPKDITFFQWLLFHQEFDIARIKEQQERQTYLDVTAFHWVVAATTRAFSDQASGLLDKHFTTPYTLTRAFPRGKRIPSEVQAGALEVGYLAWILALKQCTPDSTIHALYELLTRIQERPFCHSPTSPDKPPRRLDERQLCKSHWYFPRPSELSHLHHFLKSGLTATGLESNEDGSPLRVTSRHINEAGLVMLAILSSRTVQSVLHWPVHIQDFDSPGKDRIQLSELLLGYKRHFAHWLKAEHNIGTANAKIQLPSEIRDWLRSLHPGVGSPKILQLLPFSGEPWDKRAYRCLAESLGCTKERAELLTRDLIPRMLYGHTSNSALIHFFRSSTKNQIERHDRVALSHYLQIRGKRAIEAYSAAVEKATGIKMPSWVPGLSVRLGSPPLKTKEVKRIVSLLTKQTEDAETEVDAHNGIATLTLFMCILGTGHRRSTSPFPFPWDFFPSEGLVFICDKIVTGSEARFVPLTANVIYFLNEYADHLRRLAKKLNIQENSRRYADQISSLLGLSQGDPSIAKPTAFVPRAGVFFLLNKDGSISRTPLTTNVLDTVIKKLTGVHRVVARVRTTIAQYLWEQGCSGRTVQAFLGHQPEMHVHGPSSTWSIEDVAKRITPKLESYFHDELQIPAVKETAWAPSSLYPPLKACPHDPDNDLIAPGYEGRKRESEWAEQRARAVIRRELSEYFLAASKESGIRLDAAEKKRLEERVREELGSDPVAQKKVVAQLESQLDRLRGHPDKPIEVVERAFYLATPGPVEIGFSRSLRCALLLRSLWEGAVGKPIGRREVDPIERLAQLAISLVCFDAILAPENIEALVLSASTQQIEANGDRVTLRGGVVTNTHDFEFCVRPGFASTALLLGCTSARDHLPIGWIQVEQRVAEILQRLVRLDGNAKWTISKLCLVMRPYWMIRLPGAMYSVATGETKGPAPDGRGEAQLHGKQLASEVTPRESRPRQTNPKNNKSLALTALKKLFSNARGILERGEQRRAVQRAKLREGLRSELAEEALEYGSDTQVVRLLLSFIGRLLESGGPRKSDLAFSSIEAYFSSIAEEFINQAWDFDFEAAGPTELSALFGSVNSNLNPKSRDLVLSLFCNHLRDELSIPFFNEHWFSPREPVRVRSSLALPDHVAQAIASLNRQGGEESRNAAVFLALAHGYGLRRLEVFGLSYEQFDTIKPLYLSVRKTQIADLKTRAGRRVIARSIATDSVDAHIKQAITLAKTSTRSTEFLFESPTRDKHITNIGPVVWLATEALRQATGTSTVVPHSLRHTFATLVGIAIFAPTRGSGRHLEEIASRYLSQSYSHQVKELLQLPDDWPFGVDAIAAVLGQANSSTFLNVYFHGSHLVIADRCEAWQPRHLTQVRLANMLNRERTSLSKLSSKISTQSDRQAFDASSVVSELVRRLDRGSSTSTPSAERSDVLPTSSDRWELFLRALHYRLERDISIESMKEYVIDGLGMDKHIANQFVQAYEALVLETALDDFEPKSSSLITPIESHQVGVHRGAVEREDFVARAQVWANAGTENLSRLQRLLDRWTEKVREDKPTIVCQSASELEESVSTLFALGAKPDQLSIQLHGDVIGSWLSRAHAQYTQATQSASRASRGNQRVKVTEASISIRQISGSLIPDGRDLHRALIGLYVATSSRRGPT